MTDDLRDAIANQLAESGTAHISDDLGYERELTWVELADAVLAMPEIVDMLALRRMCGTLTVEQVARALQHASRRFAMPEHIGLLTDDEKAVAAWREPSPLFWGMTPARRAVIDRALTEAPVWEDKR